MAVLKRVLSRSGHAILGGESSLRLLRFLCHDRLPTGRCTLLTPADRSISQRFDTPLLVGRAREQQTLRDHLADALAGRGSFVLVSGEAGIGKTTLTETLCREAAEQGALVLVGRCFDLSETPPYGPWIELFGRYQPRDDLPSLPAAFAQRGTVGEARSQATLFNQSRCV